MCLKQCFVALLISSIQMGLLAQEKVQWATKVLKYSSEISSYEHAAHHVTGYPDILPNEAGNNPNAWLPSKPNKIEYIKVAFKEPMRIRQIAIGESFNPTAIFEVFTYDENDKEYLIGTYSPQQLDVKGRMFNIYTELTDYEVHAVKLNLNCGAVPGYNGIDCIAISDSKTPVTANLYIANLENTHELKSEKLGVAVNSPYEELRPVITPDGNTLYFARSYHPNNVGGEKDPEDIWVSKWDENKKEWEQAINMGSPLNNSEANYVSSIILDGGNITAILGGKYKKEKMKPGLSLTHKGTDGSWSPPEPLKIENAFIQVEDADYFLSNDKNILLIATSRFDTHGHYDIYVSFKKNRNTWTEPKNLGVDINGINEETGPMLAPDGKTLYFSSLTLPGFGGADIFMSQRLDESWTSWSEPINMGPNINSSEDEVFFNVPLEGKHAYFVRGTLGGNMDVHRVVIPTFAQSEPVVLMKGRILDAETKKPIQATIKDNTVKDGKEVGMSGSNEAGEFSIAISTGEKHDYFAEKEGYINMNEQLDLSTIKESKIIEKDVYMIPIKKGQRISLKDIYFFFNSSSLTPKSEYELNKLLSILKKNPSMKIKIAGHADNIGTWSTNKIISQDRANAVKFYLVKRGIEETRITAVAYGEDKPMATNDNEKDGRELNRRVEFEITDK